MIKPIKRFYLIFIVFISLIAVAIFLKPVMKVVAELAGYSPPIAENTGTLSGMFRSTTMASNAGAVSPPQMGIDLKLIYPQDMQENQTSAVTLQYDVITARTDPVTFKVSEESWGKLPLTIGASLNSSAFDIEPSEFLKKEPGHPLPVSFVWSISPQKEGDHILLLDISFLTSSWQPLAAVQRKLEPTPKIAFFLNEEEVSMTEFGVIQLPVKVHTILGVSNTTVDSIRAAIGLVAFVLLYTIFVDWMKARPMKRSNES
jgi:hypothetical protein